RRRRQPVDCLVYGQWGFPGRRWHSQDMGHHRLGNPGVRHVRPGRVLRPGYVQRFSPTLKPSGSPACCVQGGLVVGSGAQRSYAPIEGGLARAIPSMSPAGALVGVPAPMAGDPEDKAKLPPDPGEARFAKPGSEVTMFTDESEPPPGISTLVVLS